MPGMPVDVGDGVTVQSDIAWASSNSSPGVDWTIDGFQLNDLWFVTGIASGSRPFGQQLPAYSSSMLPNDVMDLLVSVLAQAGDQQIRASALRPAPFGQTMGFRCDLSFVARDGQQERGTALFAQRQGKLDMIVYLAPEEYYFDHGLPAIEKVFGSIRTAGGA